MNYTTNTWVNLANTPVQHLFHFESATAIPIAIA